MVHTGSDKYKVLIIGAGQIGAFYDDPYSSSVLTHAHAFIRHQGFDLLGFVDTDKQKSEQAALLWGGKAFSSIESAFNGTNIDVVCIAVPDSFHYEVLKALSQLPIKLVFAEKPLTKTIPEAVDILQLYREKNIPVAVNYSRRYVPGFEVMKQNISDGLYGSYITGTGYYGKGILHNGSHMIDLLRFLIGEVRGAKAIDRSFDFYSDDPSVSAILTLEDDKPFFMQHIDCNLYTIFELDLLFERGRVRIKDAGFNIEVYEVKENEIFKGYKNIVVSDELDTSMGDALYYAATNIYNYFTEGEKLKCSMEDGYKAMEVCTKIGED